MVISRGSQPRSSDVQGKLFARAGSSDHSVRTVNLNRLCKQVEPDILSAALMLREELIRSFLKGEPIRNEYAQQISINLNDAGFPADWLDTSNALITPDLLKSLRELATMSPQKAPIRRENLKRLMAAFEGKLDILADALEVIVPSLKNIAGGSATLDDQRMGHINPRLMAAGFPDGWLEQPTTVIEPAWVDKLTELATDAYERALESETRQEHAAEQKAAEREAQLTSILNASQVALPDSKTSETSVSKPTTSVKGAAAAGAASKSTKLPAGIGRGTMSAGRPIPGGRPMRAAPSPDTSPVAANAPVKKPVVAKKAAAAPVVAAPVKKPVAKKAAAAPVVAAPVKKPVVAKKAAVAAPVVAAPPAEKITREHSLRRAAALESLMNTARRGARVCLWRELLGKSLPYSGNIRNGAIMFRDELATEVAEVLGLPGLDWFDNPSFPPATLSPWLTDKNLPLPASREEALKLAAKEKASPSKKTAKPPAPAPAPSAKIVRPLVAQTMAVTAAQMPGASAAKMRAMGSLARQSGHSAPTTHQAASVAAPAPVATVTPAAAVVALAPPAAKVGFVWTPAAGGTPLAAPGPLAQALAGEIQRLSTAGAFTENDAINLLYYLMECRK